MTLKQILSTILSSTSLVLFFCTFFALPELAFLPLDALGTRSASELWLQFDHTGPNGVPFTAGLVALRPLRPLRHHAVDSWKEEQKEGNKRICQ